MRSAPSANGCAGAQPSRVFASSLLTHDRYASRTTRPSLGIGTGGTTGGMRRPDSRDLIDSFCSAVIRRETNSVRTMWLSAAYLTALAYGSAFITFHVARALT